jgi:hypothetical protein
MSEHRPELEALEQYLDGDMPEAVRARIEQQLARDPNLRAQIERQARIDQSLRRTFSVTGNADAILAGLIVQPHSGNGRAHSEHRATSNTRPASGLIRKPLAVAAAVVFILCGPFAIYFAWDSFQHEAMPALVVHPKVEAPLDKLYRREVAEGFKCEWDCKSAGEFGAYFAASFGEPLMMRDLPQNVVGVGLKYVGGLTPNTITYMARVNDQPVLVFADKLAADKAQKLKDPKLKIFQRKIGELVLYEVTPLNEPKLLDLFYKP